MIKTVVELDLAGYSSIARELEENLSADAVAQQLNDQIQRFVDSGLAAVNVPRDQSVMATTGDGAILVFDEAEQAHHFAQGVHNAALAHNADKTVRSAQRWFRIGAATGDIVLNVAEKKMAGITIANAVRLEGAANVGELLIDIPTYDKLPDSLKTPHIYDEEELVEGKRDEQFRARRCVMVNAPAEYYTHEKAVKFEVAVTRSGRRDILELFEKLYPEAELEKLIFLLEMDVRYQPSQRLPYAERWTEVMKWAVSPAGPGLETLGEELRYLVGKNNPL